MSPVYFKETPPLDHSLYALSEESSAFFKSVTGIHDDDKLRDHILAVQAQPYAVVPYPCIRSFVFTKVGISRMPAYQGVLKLGQERKGAFFLDIGCCFGNDARKVALDGFPVRQIIASDLKQELWDFGHILFRSNPKSFPATFIAGNALDSRFLSPFALETGLSTGVNLSNLSTLNELHGKVSAIWAASFFHLFPEKVQRHLAYSLGSLLSPESGSVIFGYHVASPNKGVYTSENSAEGAGMFCHDPESWKEMWAGGQGALSDNTGVFLPDSVKVESVLK